jgi:hypothetical protein
MTPVANKWQRHSTSCSIRIHGSNEMCASGDTVSNSSSLVLDAVPRLYFKVFKFKHNKTNMRFALGSAIGHRFFMG